MESTGAGGCTDRGLCEEVCYLGARRMEDGKLSVDRERSFGCALCLDACPEECTWMVTRT